MEKTDVPRRWRGQAEIRRRPGVGSHMVLMADGDQLRAGTASWVEHELHSGSKVLYKGWMDSGPEGHWMVDDPASPTRAALTSGQLELLDFPTVVQRCGGTTEGLWELQHQEVAQALDEGWPTIALAQESTYRPMATVEEADEFARQEQLYDRLGQGWRINTLCQLSLTGEMDDAVRASAAVHHRDLLAVGWSARSVRGRWSLAGELDIAVHREFAGALRGLVHAARDSPTTDIGIDLRQVAFIDVACAQALIIAAGSLPAPQRLVLHHSPALLREILETVGRPASMVVDGPPGR